MVCYHQVPGAGLQDKPQRLHSDRLVVGQVQFHPAVAPDTAGDPAQLSVRDPVPGPRVGIVHEPARQDVRMLGERCRDGVAELVPRLLGGRTEPEPVRHLRLADQEQALCLVQGQPGQPGLEAIN